jgi:serine/threonine-protein kinase
MLNDYRQPGAILAGKYRVERVLGEGGMGVVLAARHLELGELVAIKLIGNDVQRDKIQLERFRREARAMMRIKSEHVVRTYDIGRLEDDTPFMVMEYLEGQDLTRRLQQTGPLTLHHAVDLMMEACDALAHAHCLGIVHRDLKPSNLFLVKRPDGREHLKVIDFGIAKQSNLGHTGSSLSLTRTKQIVGSPQYMAPEQMSSAKSVDARADIWSLGVTLFELLTGHVPFVGKTMVSLYKDISTSEPPAIRRYRPELPLAVESAVCRCMQKDRERRFNSVAELGAALRPFASPQCTVTAEHLAAVLGRAGCGATPSEPPPSWRRGPGSKRPLVGPGSTQQVSGVVTSSANQHVGGWLLLALLFTGLLVALGIWLLGNSKKLSVLPDLAGSVNATASARPVPTGVATPRLLHAQPVASSVEAPSRAPAVPSVLVIPVDTAGK